MALPNYQHPLHKNVLFPIFLLPFLTTQITFATQVQESENGREVRRPKRVTPIRKYTLSKCKIAKKDFKELSNFFHDTVGKLYSFLLLDIHNFYATNQSLLSCPQSCEISQSDSSSSSELKHFFLAQTYSNQDNAYSAQRIIKTPDVDSIKLSTSNQKSNYDQASGIMTVSTQVYSDTKVEFKFYTPVRFENDSLEYTGHYSSNYIMIENLALKEVIL
jgi:uncharacterized protein (TIGR02217 family)